jgi:hypothetical protein
MALSADGVVGDLCKAAECGVAGGVAERVVERLEAIEIEHHHRQRARRMATGEGLRDAVQAGAVERTGEPVALHLIEQQVLAALGLEDQQREGAEDDEGDLPRREPGAEIVVTAGQLRADAVAVRQPGAAEEHRYGDGEQRSDDPPGL